MKLSILAVIWALSAALGQAADNSCCELKVLVSPDVAAQLTVTIANVNVPVVRVLITQADRDFEVRVTTDNGREVERTEWGKRMLSQSFHGSIRDEELGTGQSVRQELDLSRLFELRSGTYEVALARFVFVDDVRVRLEATAEIKIP